MSKKLPLALNNLDLLDANASLGHLVRKALKQVAMDLRDRPSVKKRRTISVELAFEPQEFDGVCTDALMDATVKIKLPAVQSPAYSLQVHPKGEFLFNPDSPDDHRQETLDLSNPKPPKGDEP